MDGLATASTLMTVLSLARIVACLRCEHWVVWLVAVLVWRGWVSACIDGRGLRTWLRWGAESITYVLASES